MKVTYDKSADAAYIYFARIDPGGVEFTYLCNLKFEGMINLDFNKENQLLGIEVLNASRRLPKEILDSAEIL